MDAQETLPGPTFPPFREDGTEKDQIAIQIAEDLYVCAGRQRTLRNLA